LRSEQRITREEYSSHTVEDAGDPVRGALEIVGVSLGPTSFLHQPVKLGPLRVDEKAKELNEKKLVRDLTILAPVNPKTN
jgi:hypothetical protein